MFKILHYRNNRYSSSLLFFIVLCILVVCTANEKPELEKLSYAGSNNSSSITSSWNELYDIVFDDVTSYSVIKSIVSKKTTAGKTIGSMEHLTCVMIGSLFILVGICIYFLKHFYRKNTSSHHFIITYIHNLDGMKS